MARGKRISDETRAAVIAGLAAGKTIHTVAAETGVSVGTVGTIRQQIPAVIEKVKKAADADIGTMIAKHLQTHLQTLDAYARETSKPEYLRTQTAGEIAALHAAVSGHAWRLIDLAARFANAGAPIGGGTAT